MTTETTTTITTENSTAQFQMWVRDEHVDYSSEAVHSLYQVAQGIGFQVDEIDDTNLFQGTLEMIFTASGPTEKILPWLEKMCKEGSHSWYDWDFHFRSGNSHWIQSGKGEPEFRGHVSDYFLSEYVSEGVGVDLSDDFYTLDQHN